MIKQKEWIRMWNDIYEAIAHICKMIDSSDYLPLILDHHRWDDALNPLRRWFAWHVDSSFHPRSIRHLTRTLSKRSRAQYFLWHELSSRSRRLQRFRYHGKRWRFDSANALRNIESVDGSIFQLSSSFPARIDFCALTTTYFGRHNCSSESAEFNASKIIGKYWDLT